MGAVFSRNKGDGKKRTFRFWPTSHDHLNSSKKVLNSSKDMSKSQPLTPNNQQQWTEVTLVAPNNILDSIEKDIVTVVPVPPPRKRRSKTVSPVIEKISIEKSSKVEAYGSGTPVNLVPVEETIIVPKKEPVHICDGTHHHVRNEVNGKIIHDTIIITPPKKKETNFEMDRYNPVEETPIKETPIKKDDKEKSVVRPKNLSTVSLPNFDELNIKSIRKHSHSKDSKKKPKRHISVVSLPTHNKTTLSDATIARLENYMARCKSFGGLPPKELFEKLQTQLDFSSDSEESWDGIDDWDMEVFEHTGVEYSPVTPKSRVAVPSTVSATTKTTTTAALSVHTASPILTKSVPYVPPQAIENDIESHASHNYPPHIIPQTIMKDIDSHASHNYPPHIIPQTIMKDTESHASHNYPPHITPHVTYTHTYLQSDIRVPTPIDEDDEDIKSVPQGIITLKKREGRRESIDDFFDSKGENPLMKIKSLKPDNYLGRRGSDGFFGYNKANILRDLSLKAGSHFSQSMLESESDHTKKLAQRRKSAGAALHRIYPTEIIDDEEEEEMDEDFRAKEEDTTLIDESISNSNEDNAGSKRDSLIENDDFVLISKTEATSMTHKPEVVEHSNLLKFLKTDSQETEPNKEAK